MPTNFPNYADAPAALLAVSGHCGLLAAWAVLRHFRKRISAVKLMQSCGYSRRYGVFTIGLACALAESGLQVEFHSQFDPAPKPLERRLFSRARRLDFPIRREIDVASLLHALSRGWIPIVFYDTSDGNGHFSPLLGVKGRRLLLPHSETGSTSFGAFARAWQGPSICQQAVLAKAE